MLIPSKVTALQKKEHAETVTMLPGWAPVELLEMVVDVRLNKPTSVREISESKVRSS